MARKTDDLEEFYFSGNGTVLAVGTTDRRLYVNGQPVVTEQRIVLTAWQKTISSIVAIAAFCAAIAGCVQGVDAGHNFACKLEWIERGCAHP